MQTEAGSPVSASRAAAVARRPVTWSWQTTTSQLAQVLGTASHPSG